MSHIFKKQKVDSKNTIQCETGGERWGKEEH